MSGFTLQANGLTISKDPKAVLTYAFDWVDWLPTTDNLLSVDYTVQARLNDPSPVVIVSSGIDTTQTYVQLSGGQINKSYKISAKITTELGLIDNRIFTVNVIERSA